MSDLGPALWLLVGALLVALAAWVPLVRLRGRLRDATTRADELQQQLQLVRQSISGLTAGAVGMDRRLAGLEQREKKLAERQEDYEIQHADDQPYMHAIRLVQQGAGINRLVSELALSESEAELIVRLHGQRDSA